jgi:hypothetical protein
MIDATQKKLREARFFLRKLQEETRRVTRNDPEESAFYLSAFLSAARSVTFALQVEAKEKYDKWFPGWEAAQSQEDRELLGYMNKQRVAEVHQGGSSDLSAEPDWIPVTQFRSDRYGHPAYGIHWTAMPGADPPKIGVPVLVFVKDGDERRVMEACRAYEAILGRLVSDFLKTHVSDTLSNSPP